MMFQVRFHGRGGQGVVSAAEMLALAAFAQGRHAQAFPTFGSERTGAPVVAFCRISDRPIRAHDPVLRPDAIVVQDPTLLSRVPVLAGAAAGTYVVVNTARPVTELSLDAVPGASSDLGRLCAVSATDLARRHLGRPLPNTALLGALAAVTGVVTIEAVTTAIRQRFEGTIAEQNVCAAQAAYALLDRADAASQPTPGPSDLEGAGREV